MLADLAQLVRALVCGTRCREFESHNPPHTKEHPLRVFFCMERWSRDLNSREVSSTTSERHTKVCR